MRFHARTNRPENTLFIRQDDVKEEWSVELNGRKVGKLFQMEADLIQTLPLPPGSLHAGENTLSIIPAKTGDDIFVGEVWLDARPATEAVGLAALSVEVTDLESKRGLPCRITVVNDSDTLMPLAAAPGQHLAVRPGVVYTPDGRASLRLSPGELQKCMRPAGLSMDWPAEECACARVSRRNCAWDCGARSRRPDW